MLVAFPFLFIVASNVMAFHYDPNAQIRHEAHHSVEGIWRGMGINNMLLASNNEAALVTCRSLSPQI